MQRVQEAQVSAAGSWARHLPVLQNLGACWWPFAHVCEMGFGAVEGKETAPHMAYIFLRRSIIVAFRLQILRNWVNNCF